MSSDGGDNGPLGGPGFGFLEPILDPVSQLTGGKWKDPGTNLIREGVNEASGYNKKREEVYKKKVVQEAEDAKRKLFMDQVLRNQNLDLIASRAAGRASAKRGGSSLSYQTPTGGDKLGR